MLSGLKARAVALEQGTMPLRWARRGRAEEDRWERATVIGRGKLFSLGIEIFVMEGSLFSYYKPQLFIIT